MKNTSCGTHQISYAQNTPFSKIAFVDIKSRRQYTQKSIIVNDRQSVEQKMKFTENQFHRVYEGVFTLRGKHAQSREKYFGEERLRHAVPSG